MEKIENIINDYRSRHKTYDATNFTDVEPDDQAYYWRNECSRLMNSIIKDLEQLDQSLPKPVEVPEFVASWHEEHRHDTLETKFRRAQVDKDERVREWYDNCQGRHANKRANAQEVIAKMDLNGYTVIKEPLYWIYDPVADQYLGYDRVREKVWWLKKRSSGARAELTDAEITKIGEQYRTFAVPVEEEAQ